MPTRSTNGPRGERTRSTILEVAEPLFAQKGFERTRLEDVAEAVGIRRSSIVYYFPDKNALYDAVLSDIFSGLLEHVREALETNEPLERRVGRAISRWVDYVAERPSLARILLREVADGSSETPALLRKHTRPFFEMIIKVLELEPRSANHPLRHVDPIQLSSAVCGFTVFRVAGLPALLPSRSFDPLDRIQLETLRADVLSIAEHFLTPQSSIGEVKI